MLNRAPDALVLECLNSLTQMLVGFIIIFFLHVISTSV